MTKLKVGQVDPYCWLFPRLLGHSTRVWIQHRCGRQRRRKENTTSGKYVATCGKRVIKESSTAIPEGTASNYIVNHQLKRIIIQYSDRCINVSRAFVGALHGVNRAPGICVMLADNSDTGGKTVHFSSPSQQTTLVPESTPPISSETTSTGERIAVVKEGLQSSVN